MSLQYQINGSWNVIAKGATRGGTKTLMHMMAECKREKPRLQSNQRTDLPAHHSILRGLPLKEQKKSQTHVYCLYVT